MISNQIVVIGLIVTSAAGCTLIVPERERRRFDCGGVSVTVSTRQRVPDWFGGEEYVYTTTTAPGGIPIRAELDNNGRWIDRLGVSVAEDGSWVRFHVMDPRGPAADRYRYFSVAFVEVRKRDGHSCCLRALDGRGTRRGLVHVERDTTNRSDNPWPSGDVAAL